MLGPARGTQEAREDKTWTAADAQILEFLNMWSCYQSFAGSASHHWIGPRSCGLSTGTRRPSCSTRRSAGHSCKRVGWVAPWDISSRYRLRLPGVAPKRSGGLQRSLGGPKAAVEQVLEADICAGMRKDWRHVTAYCIDAASATDIDDAISVERTGAEDEFLIHVHVADPGSRIFPDNPLALQAALIPQTAYLPGHFERMFTSDIVRERLLAGAGPAVPDVQRTGEPRRRGARARDHAGSAAQCRLHHAGRGD